MLTHLSCSSNKSQNYIRVDFSKKPLILPNEFNEGVSDIWRPCYCNGCGEFLGMLANVDSDPISEGRLAN